MHVVATSKSVLRRSLRSSAGALLGVVFLGACTDVPEPSERTAIGGPAGHYTGSEACRDCHATEYRAWAGSRHRSTLRPWAMGQPLPLAAAKLDPSYRLEADGSASGPGADGRQITGRVAFLMGGRHREDILVRLDDGRVQDFPVAYDVDRREAFEPLRDLAGGATPPPDAIDFWTRVGRNADLACYGCHATGHTLVSDGVSPTGLVLPGSRWVEPGVGCEGCHGPGGPHVAAARAGRPKPGDVKLGRSAAAGTVDACAGCHGLREVLASPFSDVPAHRYGDPLYLGGDPLMTVASNFEFREPFFGDLRPATYQQEAVALSQSGCAIRGGLRCAACHDAHSGAPTAALTARDGGDGLCASCHPSQAAEGARHTLHPQGTQGSRCLDCHMAFIVRGSGRSAARDHTLAPPVAEPGKVPAACAACHAGAPNAAAVATAWTRVVEGPAARRRREIGAAVDGAETPSGVSALLRLAADPAGGWFLRWAAIQRILSASTPRRTDELIATLRGALVDRNPALRRVAARAIGRFGRASDFEALEQATRDPDPWTALAAAQALGTLGAPSATVTLQEVARRPDLVTDARAQFAYGHALLLSRDWPQAGIALRRALELNPMMVGAINDLGLGLRGEGKNDQAVAAWRRALEINPRFAPARQNLDAATTPAASNP